MSDLKPKRLFTIKEVSIKTGLSTQLIRKWEERYGAVAPERFPNGYRGYSREHVEKLIWLKGRVDEGVPIGLAVMDYESANAEAPRPFAPVADASVNENELESYRNQLVELFLRMEGEAAQRLFDRLVSLHHMDFVLIQVLQPVLVRIGELWESGEVSEYQEHFASNFIRERIQALKNFMFPNTDRPLLVTACAPGERHEIGILFFGYFAMKLGLPIVYLGASPAEKGILDCIRERKPDAFVLSVSSKEVLRLAREFFMELDRTIREECPSTKVFIGGRAVEEDRIMEGTKQVYFMSGNSHDAIRKIKSMLE